MKKSSLHSVAVHTIAQVLNTALGVSRRFAVLAVGVPVMVGLTLFGVELVFASLLQASLAAAGSPVAAPAAFMEWLGPITLEKAVLALLGVGTFRALLFGVQFMAQVVSTETFRLKLRHLIVDDVSTGSAPAFDRVLAHFTEDVNRTGDALFWISSLILASVQVVVAVFGLLYIAPQVTLTLMGVAVLILVPLQWISGKKLARSTRASELWQVVVRDFLDALRHHTMLTIYGAAAGQYKKVKTTSADQSRGIMLGYFVTGIKSVNAQILGIACIVAILYAAGRWVPFAGGVLLPYLYVLGRTAQNVSACAQYFGNLSTFSGNVAAVSSYTQRRAVTAGSASAEPRAVAAVRQIGWKLEGVTFRHAGAPRSLFEDFSLTIEPGTFTLVSGPSGIGKSTLLHLILGNVQPSAGRVLLEHAPGSFVPISRHRADLLPHVGYVGSDSELLRCSIRENLVLGLATVPNDAEIHSVLEACRCQFVQGLKNGIDTVVMPEDSDISTGQRQRIALARALLRKPHALLLDEATANLDDETAAVISSQLARLKGKVTIVAISHGKHFAELADVRVTLQGGERGVEATRSRLASAS